LHPTSWSGSIIPYVKAYLSPLKEWFDHPVPALSLWAREMHGDIERQIDAYRKRESEEL
jgi:hypothetical protein